MKKGTGTYLKQEVMIIVCDHCGKELSTNYITYDFRWNDGYDYYGDVIEVCSMDCLTKELKTAREDYYFPGGEDTRLYMPSSQMKRLLLGE